MNAYLRQNWQYLRLYILPALFLIAGIILRATLRSSQTLWEDEIIAATHAVQPLWRLVVNCLVNDMHPPLYFMELHFWSAFNQSDWWLIANSVVFSLLAVASIFVTVRRLHGTLSAFNVASVLAVLPVCLGMAEEVRMYSMLSVLLIWMYYFTYRAFAAPEPSPRPYFSTAVLALAIVYTHAVGLIAVLFYGFYAASWLVTRKAVRNEGLAWLAVFGGVGVLSLPMALADMLHKADMPAINGVNGLLSWMSDVVIGNGALLSHGLYLAGLLTYLATITAGMLMRQTRRVTFFFLILPILFCGLTEIVARPLFKADFFSNFYSPFLAIVIGTIITEASITQNVRCVMQIATLSGLLVMAVSAREAVNTTEHYYGDTIRTIKDFVQPGDVVWTPQGDIFWALCWYMAGPNWGSPVSINAPLHQGSGWYRVFDLLGPDLVAKLDLLPKSQSITTSNGVTLMTAAASQPKAERANRLWLVTYAPRSDVPAGLPGEHVGPLERSRAFSFPPLQLNLYEKR